MLFDQRPVTVCSSNSPLGITFLGFRQNGQIAGGSCTKVFSRLVIAPE